MMGKRSTFDRKSKDFYETFDPRAPRQLVNEFPYGATYCEPCCGDGALIANINNVRPDLRCVVTNELHPELYYFEPDVSIDIRYDNLYGGLFDFYIMNCPWKRHFLHAIIAKLMEHRPVWALIDSNWKETTQERMAKKHNLKTVKELMRHCVKVKSAGRLKWIRGSKHVGKDDCSWYLFDKNFTGETVFIGR